MFSELKAVICLVAFAFAIALLWYMVPRGGKVRPLATKPYLQSIIPLAIIFAAVFGVAAFVSALF
jgi:hypothetical protein